MNTKLAQFDDDQSQLGMSFAKVLCESEERVTRAFMITKETKGWEDSDMWRERVYVSKHTLKPIQTISGKIAVMWFQRDFYAAYAGDIRWWYQRGIQFQFRYY